MDPAREEFKNIANYLLFLSSYEPVVTPTKITGELIKVMEKAGDVENILFWNKICWTPKQLGLLTDESLIKVLFLSPPSCGKTYILKAKAKQFAQKGKNVLVLLPSKSGIETLLSFHLKLGFGIEGFVQRISFVKQISTLSST